MSAVSSQPERLLRRVGHKGADLIAPGNTRESFDAALAAQVDMIEFDVLPAPGTGGEGPLFLAHDYTALDARERLTLEDGLDHLAAEGFGRIELDVDLKGRGYELRVVEALRERGLLARSLISTQYVESLAVIRASGAEVRLGWSVPKLRRDPFQRPVLLPVALPALAAYRAALPRRAAAAIRAGRCDALMAHFRLVTPRLIRAVTGANGELYVWTVDDPARIEILERMGVTGVITNDPRLFA